MRLGSFGPRIVLMPVLLALTASAIAIFAQRQVACGTDAKRETMRGMLTGIMRSDDSSTRTIRRAYRVLRVDPDSVAYIDDYRICERAAARYYRDMLGRRALRGVAVPRVRDRYIVYGYKRDGEWMVVEVYDSAFRYIATTAY
jgi:hypothetical protein